MTDGGTNLEGEPVKGTAVGDETSVDRDLETHAALVVWGTTGQLYPLSQEVLPVVVQIDTYACWK